MLLQLSEQVGDIIQAVAAHRRESARLLQRASGSYVLLFERMVTEFVRLSREHSDGRAARSSIMLVCGPWWTVTD